MKQIQNPNGCTSFEVHPFRKDKCKHCFCTWQEHLGVISPTLVHEYVVAAQRAAEENRRKEEKTHAVAQTKIAAKKKTVEDDWFFDSLPTPTKDGASLRATDVDSEDEQDVGFRMSVNREPEKVGAKRSCPTDVKPLKVVNLIDYSECDVPDVNVLKENRSASDSCTRIEGKSNRGLNHSEKELLAEIEHLRQRLADADAIRDIQVSIVQDEVQRKQFEIDELKRHCEQALERQRSVEETLSAMREQSERDTNARLELEAAMLAAQAIAQADAKEKVGTQKAIQESALLDSDAQLAESVARKDAEEVVPAQAFASRESVAHTETRSANTRVSEAEVAIEHQRAEREPVRANAATRAAEAEAAVELKAAEIEAAIPRLLSEREVSTRDVAKAVSAHQITKVEADFSSTPMSPCASSTAGRMLGNGLPVAGVASKGDVGQIVSQPNYGSLLKLFDTRHWFQRCLRTSDGGDFE